MFAIRDSVLSLLMCVLPALVHYRLRVDERVDVETICAQ